MLAEISETKWCGVLDQVPQEASSVRQITNGRSGCIVDTDVEELCEHARRTENPECGILRIDEIGRDTYDATQRFGEIQTRTDRHHGGDQWAIVVRIASRRRIHESPACRSNASALEYGPPAVTRSV